MTKFFEWDCISVILVSSFLSMKWILHLSIPVGYGYLTVFLFPIPFGFIYHVKIFIPR